MARRRRQNARFPLRWRAVLAGQESKLYMPFNPRSACHIESEIGESALSRIDGSLALATETGERWSDSFLHRFRGEILLKVDPAGAARAEEAFRAAIAVAQQQGAELAASATADRPPRLEYVVGAMDVPLAGIGTRSRPRRHERRGRSPGSGGPRPDGGLGEVPDLEGPRATAIWWAAHGVHCAHGAGDGMGMAAGRVMGVHPRPCRRSRARCWRGRADDHPDRAAAARRCAASVLVWERFRMPHCRADRTGTGRRPALGRVRANRRRQHLRDPAMRRPREPGRDPLWLRTPSATGQQRLICCSLGTPNDWPSAQGSTAPTWPSHCSLRYLRFDWKHHGVGTLSCAKGQAPAKQE